MNLPAQTNRFQLNWENFSPQFPTKTWNRAPDFLYFVEIPLTLSTQQSMQKVSQKLQQEFSALSHWVTPERMHITIALPGRLGVHFQGNDVTRMQKKLTEILQQFNPFELVLGNLNCFSEAIFREVYEQNGHLSLLHYQICEAIPFAQAPEFQFKNFLPHVSLFYAEASNTNVFTDWHIFNRSLEPETLTVDRIIFGRSCQEMNGPYQREVIAEYNLTTS
jgi:2'-5' RNA ligase